MIMIQPPTRPGAATGLSLNFDQMFFISNCCIDVPQISLNEGLLGKTALVVKWTYDRLSADVTQKRPMDDVFVKVKYKMVSEPDFHEYPISGTIPGHLQSAAVPGDFDLSKSYIVILSVFEGSLDEPSSQSESLYVPIGVFAQKVHWGHRLFLRLSFFFVWHCGYGAQIRIIRCSLNAYRIIFNELSKYSEFPRLNSESATLLDRRRLFINAAL